MSFRRILWAAATLGLSAFLIAGGANASAVSDDQWEKKFDVTGKPDVRVETNDAHVKVSTWDRKEVEARVLVRGWSIGPDGNQVRVTPRVTGDRIELEVKVPRVRWNLGYENRSVNIELTLPREANLAANTGDGHVTVCDLKGNLDVRTGDGHITLSDIRGEMKLYTGDGHIEGDHLDGKLDVQTGDGRIRVNGRFDALELRTGDGSIEAEAAKGSKIETRWALSTGDGHIRLRVPSDINADLDAHTNDGRISLDIPVTVSDGLSTDTVRGKLNAGGPLLRLRTGDGSIRLEKQ